MCFYTYQSAIEVKMAAQSSRKDYYESFVHQSPEETEPVVCPVCFNVLCESKLAACCGHSACSACVDRIESGEKSCPLCSWQIEVVKDKHLEQTLDGMTVHCPCKEQGCECTGKLMKVNNHHDKQPSAENVPTGCQCQKICCEACQSHQTQCQQMEHRGSSRSPENDSEVECEYQYVGCEFQGSQVELDRHMSEAIGTHLSLLSKFVWSRLSHKDDTKAIKEEFKKLVPQQDSGRKEKPMQEGKVKVVEVQQQNEQSPQVQQLVGVKRIRQSKKLNYIVPYWIMMLCFFLVVGSVSAYLYQEWHSEHSCSQDLHEEQLSNPYMKKIDLDGRLQQLDYRVTHSNTLLQAILDELKLTVSETTRDIEGIRNDLNDIKEILLRTQQKQSVKVKEKLMLNQKKKSRVIRKQERLDDEGDE